jgi:hypothetical protein
MRRQAVVALALLALAGLSLLIWPAPPGYDAWIWLDWGRDLAHLHLDTDPGSTGVAWKPLPALLAAPLSLFGGAAPDAWVLVVRAAALASLALAYRLGVRLGGRIAGVVAVVAIVLLPDYWGVIARADAEPILVALVFGAAELHFSGRRIEALAAIAAAALIRPEVWPFLAAYAAFVWLTDARARPLVGVAVAAVPLLWFGLDWLGSGDPLTGPGTARGVHEHASAGEALGAAVGALAPPLWVFVAVAVAPEAGARRGFAAWARRPEVFLTAAALAWLAFVVILGALGYIGSERFAVGPACLLCPVVGVGAARALRPLAGRWRIVAAVVLVGFAVPLVKREVDRTEARFDALVTRADSDALAQVVESSRARERMHSCDGRAIIDDGRLLARLVYELDVSPSSVTGLPVVIGLNVSAEPGMIFARTQGRAANELGPALGGGAPAAANDDWQAFAIRCTG